MLKSVQIALTIALLLLVQGANAQLSDIVLKGPDKMTLAVKGGTGGKVTVEAVGTLDVEANGDVSYSNDAVFEFDGRVDSSGKKPVLVLDPADITALETEIGTLLTDLTPITTVTSVTVGKNKSKLGAKLKDGFTTAKAGLAVAFSAQTNLGDVTGKLALSAVVSDIPLCTVCGKSFAGVESFKQSLKGCGSLSGQGNASLDIAPDLDENGTSTFTYTNSDGLALDGTLVQDGKKLTCSLGGPSTTDLENALAGNIVDECGVGQAFVSVTAEKCSGKPGKTGDSASFAFAVEFDATDGQQASTGKSATKGSFAEVP